MAIFYLNFASQFFWCCIQTIHMCCDWQATGRYYCLTLQRKAEESIGKTRNLLIQRNLFCIPLKFGYFVRQYSVFCLTLHHFVGDTHKYRSDIPWDAILFSFEFFSFFLCHRSIHADPIVDALSGKICPKEPFLSIVEWNDRYRNNMIFSTHCLQSAWAEPFWLNVLVYIYTSITHTWMAMAIRIECNRLSDNHLFVHITVSISYWI